MIIRGLLRSALRVVIGVLVATVLSIVLRVLGWSEFSVGLWAGYSATVTTWCLYEYMEKPDRA